MSDDGNPAVFVGTFLQNGDSVALCEDCLAGFAAALTSQIHGIDPDDLAALVQAAGNDDIENAVERAAEVAYPIDPPPAGEAEQPAQGEQPADPGGGKGTPGEGEGADDLAPRRKPKAA